MAKFNVVQKRRRAAIADRKRATKGDPFTGKVKIKPQPHSISGKRQRKLFKKWRRDQKEAVEKGFVTLQDVEMAVVQGTSTSKDASKHPSQFHVKKGLRLKVKQMKKKGKNKQKSLKTATETPVDAMID